MVQKRHGLLLGIVSTAIMLLCGGALWLSWFSMYIHPEKAWGLTLFGLLFPLLVLLNILMLIWAIALRSRSAVIPLLALIPAFFLSGRYIQFNKASEATGSGEIVSGKAGKVAVDGAVKVLTWNVGKFSAAKKSTGLDSWQTCADSVFTALRKMSPDVICLQEFHLDKASRINDFLKAKYPGWEQTSYTYTNTSGCYGCVILSRFPILGKGKFDFSHSSNLAIYADIETPSQRLRVYNCHFESYSISPERLIASLDSSLVRETESKLKHSIMRRPSQAQIIADDIDASPYDVIVTGDFNDNPVSYTYRLLAGGRKDAFVEAGRGLGQTYAKMGPFLRIDYVLFPKDWKALDYVCPKLKLSDHYPVATTLAPQKK